MPPPDGTSCDSNPSVPQGLTEFQSTNFFSVKGTTAVHGEAVFSHDEAGISADDEAGVAADDEAGISAADEAGVADDKAIAASGDAVSSSDRTEFTWEKNKQPVGDTKGLVDSLLGESESVNRTIIRLVSEMSACTKSHFSSKNLRSIKHRAMSCSHRMLLSTYGPQCPRMPAGIQRGNNMK